MKPSAISIEELLAEALADTEPQANGVGWQATPDERADMVIGFRAALADAEHKIRTVCVACSSVVPILDTTPCECGGFVCHPCRKLEVEGECDHTPFVPPE